MARDQDRCLGHRSPHSWGDVISFEGRVSARGGAWFDVTLQRRYKGTVTVVMFTFKTLKHKKNAFRQHLDNIVSGWLCSYSCATYVDTVDQATTHFSQFNQLLSAIVVTLRCQWCTVLCCSVLCCACVCVSVTVSWPLHCVSRGGLVLSVLILVVTEGACTWTGEYRDWGE